MKPDCLIMHPGPINRGVEIDSEVADGNQSVILDRSPTVWPCAWLFCISAEGSQHEPTIIRNGRVIDPANNRDESVTDRRWPDRDSIRNSQPAIRDRRNRWQGPHRCARPHRHACPPARTRFCSQGNDCIRCASSGGGWVYHRCLHAEHFAGCGYPEHHHLDKRSRA